MGMSMDRSSRYPHHELNSSSADADKPARRV